MNYFENENVVKNHTLFTQYKAIQKICAPLKKIGVKGFIFMRHFSDGSFLDLATHIEWADLFFNRFFNEHYCPRNIYDHMFVANDISLWKHNTNNEIWADGANQFDLDNGISIRRHDIDFTDTYCFYSNKNSPHMNQFYFDNMNLLMMFINYFLVQIRPILARQYYERIVTPPCYMTTSHSPLLNEPTSHIDVDEFINSIRNSNNKDSFNESIKALSEREVQCILLFAEGLTTNEAAEKLNLSPRTIESHISNARIKLDCKNVVSLVAKYMRNNIN